MYPKLLFLHSLTRWFVLLSLLHAVYRAYKGLASKSAFTKTDDAVRHWTATIAHIQLMIGVLLYFQSPLIQYFMSDFRQAVANFSVSFFALVHSTLMLSAVVVITIGSSKAKRMKTDRQKFKTMLAWFLAGLILIFIAIPWPFSPLANRPYFR